MDGQVNPWRSYEIFQALALFRSRIQLFTIALFDDKGIEKGFRVRFHFG